jgi:hypothetical protein
MDDDHHREKPRKSQPATAMTTSQRIKLSLIALLDASKPDESIAVVDAKQRGELALPLLAVDVTAASAHSEALQNVERIDLTATLRVHAGDDEDIDAWIDQIETTLTDVSFIKAATSDLVKVYAWTYSGSTQEWDESVLEVAFAIETMCSRFDPQPQNDAP